MNDKLREVTQQVLDAWDNTTLGWDGVEELFEMLRESLEQPVKEVELTDDEIAQAVGSPLDEVYLADFRAVIAAHKEKQK